MATPSDYTSGTITLTNGSANFSGTGTGWLAADFREGDLIIWVNGGENFGPPVIASISSNTAGTLTSPWRGPTLTGVTYRMRYQWDSSRVSAQSRQLIELLGNGNLQALAGVSGLANTFPYFSGPGAFSTTALTPFARTILDDTSAAQMRTTLGAGDVSGPSAAVNNRIAVFDGTTGKLIKDSGTTISGIVPGANSVPNSSLADMPTDRLKGRVAAGSGSPEDLTGAQAWSVLGTIPDARLPPRLKGISDVFPTDCNLITEAGFYRITGSTPNSPETATAVLIHIPYSATQARQIWFRHANNAYYERANVSGTWTDWTRQDIQAYTYTGANRTNADYPISEQVLVFGDIERNQTAEIRTDPADASQFVIGGSGTLLLGEWRARGHMYAGSPVRTYTLMRRVR